ncbi:beta-ketoacyl synthase family protein,acyltransferase family protein,phosphopantetheine-containing protein [Rivularia sp. PCC 7116]|uniref:type I polyketide synthase n=1 Tax=Rivularia sp. PCC 7116 TaxID=373994 RepID=UPI00029F023D|nr:type I polyketide synthase [Rivularia sp. PCC 7116]AFY58524.1 beta-ketoacyl synthase family protein,acyltransferase family protein,phosphopantetheine-containing protein [Rivularia sp. PCC 7116]
MSNTAPNVEELSPLQRSVLVIKEMKEKLEQIENKQTEPIAIVGMGCRFPGGANSPESFWKLLRDGVDVIGEIPRQRWDINAYYDPNPETANKMYCKYGGFLDEIDKFDAEFFGLTPREATSLDPQQRLLLEVSWETLENAGIAPDKLNESKTGVFVGISLNEYAQQAALGATDIDVYTATGNALSVAAGRLSYFLGLQGPALAVDTACSSSLVAVHLACQSLRTGECRQALAGGVYLMVSPQTTIAMSKLRALSVDGRCKTFDAKADGYGRGEGCGIVALKRMSDAIADGDNILALIRGSAVNQDGRSSGLTVPNAQAQQAVIREALVNAKVEPTQISYVEAHGTGTSLGDPIEVKSLGKVLGKNRSSEQPLMIGSVKTNIGHLEAAAGIASLIKVVLAMQHKEIPPHLHLNELNPHISLQDMVATIPTKPTAWVVDGQQRLASISSFGFSGTNAHMILQETPVPIEKKLHEPSFHLLTLSANNKNSLEKILQKYSQFLDEYPRASLADICFTANSGRKHFNYRLALVADSVESLYQKLQTADIKESKLNLNTKILLVFTDDGFQNLNIGRQVLNQPIFRQALDRCNEILEPYLEKSLLEILDDDKYLVIHHNIKPLILFSLEYAFAQLWLSWGIEPVAVMGEGVGEYVAACIAGVFSLENGLKLIIQREQLTQDKNGNDKIITTEIKLYQANINLIDNNTGKFLETETVTKADYWHNPVREPINFETSCSFLKKEGCELFLEIGNNPILREQAQQYLSADDIDNWLIALPDNQEYWQVLLQNLAILYEKGIEIDWDGFYQGKSYNRLQLPTYPFERQRYWIDTAKYQPRKIANQQSHPLLGEKLSSPLAQIQFESLLNIDTLPLVKDHCLGGIPVMNLVVYLEIAFAGAATIFDSKFDPKKFILTDVIVPTALTFPDKETRTVQLIFNSEDSQTSYFQIFSQGEEKNQNDWTLNAGGKLNLISTETFPSSSETVSLRDIQARCNEEISSVEFYQMMAERGATLGSKCQMLEQIWRRDGEALGKVKYPKETGLKEESLYHLPLGEIDACLQILSATGSLDSAYSYLIVGFEKFQFYDNYNEQLWCHARLKGKNFAGDAQTIIGNVCLFDATGLVLAKFTNVKLKRVSYESLQLNSQTNGKLQHQPNLLSREELIATPVPKQQEILENYLLQCLSKSLQLSPEKIKVQQFLSNYLDSLMSFELKSRIEADLQLQVPIERFFGDTNITQLAEFLLEQFTLSNLISEANSTNQSEDMEEIIL